jgi:hypothetical protein
VGARGITGLGLGKGAVPGGRVSPCARLVTGAQGVVGEAPGGRDAARSHTHRMPVGQCGRAP